jgi:hypothetical protein
MRPYEVPVPEKWKDIITSVYLMLTVSHFQKKFHPDFRGFKAMSDF